jgi:hypothetical protein
MADTLSITQTCCNPSYRCCCRHKLLLLLMVISCLALSSITT